MTLEMIEQATLWSSAGLVAERPCWGELLVGRTSGGLWKLMVANSD